MRIVASLEKWKNLQRKRSPVNQGVQVKGRGVCFENQYLPFANAPITNYFLPTYQLPWLRCRYRFNTSAKSLKKKISIKYGASWSADSISTSKVGKKNSR